MSNQKREPSEVPPDTDNGVPEPSGQRLGSKSDSPSAAIKTLATLEVAVQSMRDELTANQTRAQAREEVITSLHEQVQQLQSGDRASVIRPLVIDLGHLRNTILSQVDEAGVDISAISLAGHADEIEFILERQGILPSHPAPGDPVKIGEHKVIGLEPTGTFDADETVARVHGDGYYDTVDEKMVMPAEVVAYRYDSALAAPILSDPALPDTLLTDRRDNGAASNGPPTSSPDAESTLPTRTKSDSKDQRRR